MGTFTAQILIGSSHPYHGGIIPSCTLLLSENSRSAWCLYPFVSADKELSSSMFSDFKIWICDPDALLEEAMIMIALFVKRDADFREFASNLNGKILYERCVDFKETLSKNTRRLLYENHNFLIGGELK